MNSRTPAVDRFSVIAPINAIDKRPTCSGLSISPAGYLSCNAPDKPDRCPVHLVISSSPGARFGKRVGKVWTNHQVAEFSNSLSLQASSRAAAGFVAMYWMNELGSKLKSRWKLNPVVQIGPHLMK